MAGFWKGPAGNDTLVIHPQNHNQTFPEFDFDVPDGEVWYITNIMYLLYCGDGRSINVMDILMHIFCQQPSEGKDTIIWSVYGDDNFSAYGQYWRYKNLQVSLPLFGPCRGYIGIWNGTPYDVSAHLTFAVDTGRP